MIRSSHPTRPVVNAFPVSLGDYVVEPGRDLERLMAQAGRLAGIPDGNTKALAQGAVLLALMARNDATLPEYVALQWLLANNNEGVPVARARAARQLPILLRGCIAMILRDRRTVEVPS